MRIIGRAIRAGRLLGASVAILVPALAANAESLRDAVRATLTANPALQATDAEARAAAFELLELRGEFLPTVSVFGEIGEENVDNPANLSVADNAVTKTARQIGVSVDLTLFDGFRRSNLVYANAARLDGRIFALLDASETIGLSAVEAYVDVVRHRNLAVVARENVRRHEELADQVRQAVDGGRLPAGDGFEAENRLLAARVAELRVREAIANSNARYLRVVGNAPGATMSVPPIRNLPASATELVQTAIEGSFRVKAASSEINRRHYERGVAEADRMPRLDLNATTSKGEDQGGSRGVDDETFVGLRLSWTIYKGGRNQQTAALIERREQAILERNEAVRGVRELAESTWTAYRSDLERQRLFREQEVATENIVTQYRQEFLAGSRTLLDVLDAERNFFNVRFQRVSVDAAVSFNQYRLVATQSKLAQMFDISPSETALEPTFESRALQKPSLVFDTSVAPLR
ncbi:MAG: TolC family protein [Pseudomonadota bacterium]